MVLGNLNMVCKVLSVKIKFKVLTLSKVLKIKFKQKVLIQNAIAYLLLLVDT